MWWLTLCESNIRRGTLLIFVWVLLGVSLLAAQAGVKRPLGGGELSVSFLNQLKIVGIGSMTRRKSSGTEQSHLVSELCR